MRVHAMTIPLLVALGSLGCGVGSGGSAGAADPALDMEETGIWVDAHVTIDGQPEQIGDSYHWSSSCLVEDDDGAPTSVYFGAANLVGDVITVGFFDGYADLTWGPSFGAEVKVKGSTSCTAQFDDAGAGLAGTIECNGIPVMWNDVPGPYSELDVLIIEFQFPPKAVDRL